MGATSSQVQTNNTEMEQCRITQRETLASGTCTSYVIKVNKRAAAVIIRRIVATNISDHPSP
jgi:hypothetical protein